LDEQSLEKVFRKLEYPVLYDYYPRGVQTAFIVWINIINTRSHLVLDWGTRGLLLMPR
jgi:hypothetical protein